MKYFGVNYRRIPAAKAFFCGTGQGLLSARHGIPSSVHERFGHYTLQIGPTSLATLENISRRHHMGDGMLPLIGGIMVDFCISAVRYNEKREHIDYLKVHERTTSGTNWSFGPYRIVARAFVADLIRLNKASFETIVQGKDDLWRRGADVHVVDEIYLSTDRNQTKRDNLSNLPEY